LSLLALFPLIFRALLVLLLGVFQIGSHTALGFGLAHLLLGFPHLLEKPPYREDGNHN
jgi:hypothetical protein